MRTKVKRERDRVLNEATGQYEWVWVESTRYIHDEEDRVLAALDFLKGENTPEELVEKHHISNIQVLFSWVGRYLSENRLVSLQENNDDTMANKSKDEQIRELKAELKKARKEAELEKLRAHAYDTMINLAEERFNIPIRKKIWHQTVSLLREESSPASMNTLAGCLVIADSRSTTVKIQTMTLSIMP